MLFQDLVNNSSAAKVNTIFIAAGVLAGIVIGIKSKDAKHKAGRTILLAVGLGTAGAVLGVIYTTVTTSQTA